MPKFLQRTIRLDPDLDNDADHLKVTAAADVHYGRAVFLTQESEAGYVGICLKPGQARKLAKALLDAVEALPDASGRLPEKPEAMRKPKTKSRDLPTREPLAHPPIRASHRFTPAQEKTFEDARATIRQEKSKKTSRAS